MNRYSNTRKKRDKDGKVVYGTTYYPEISVEDSDVFIRTVFGARLDNLAYQYYGDVSLWWIIAKANGIRGKVGLEAGTLLRIPGNTAKIVSDFRKLNS
tara:strand:- start:720 stop:1013 length:294 start_codon:yes stop_codon:yes gene_type:complete